MGTTRMASDPRRGVTDGWGRVHGLPNLHIAGSSLFPTAGWANPTLTILALSLRTADRIADELDAARPAFSASGRFAVPLGKDIFRALAHFHALVKRRIIGRAVS